MILRLALCALLLAGCAAGYAHKGRVGGAAIGSASIESCEPVREADEGQGPANCQKIEGSPVSVSGADLLRYLAATLAGVLAGMAAR